MMKARKSMLPPEGTDTIVAWTVALVGVLWLAGFIVAMLAREAP